jgi:hypothetical protein
MKFEKPKQVDWENMRTCLQKWLDYAQHCEPHRRTLIDRVDFVLGHLSPDVDENFIEEDCIKEVKESP